MRTLIIKLLGVVLIMGAGIPAFAQYTFFSPKGSFAIEVSLENTDMKRLPIYRNAITSLSVMGDHIVGGTSADEGLSPFVFVASLDKRELVEFLDVSDIIKSQQSIRSGFVKDKQGQLFAGTMPQGSDNTGGHIVKVKINAKGKIKLEDLGIPVAGEGVYAITSDAAVNKIYGMTYPSRYFFSYDIKSKKTKVYKDLAPSKKVKYSLEDQFSVTPADYLSRALVTDNKGLVYGSLPYGKLFFFNPANETLTEMEDELPEVWGRRSLGQIHSWLKTKEGKIFGANRADGQLFELNTTTKKIKNLGKPIMMPKLAGLAEGSDGNIYGISGGAPGYAHLFSYNESVGFKDYGNPEFDMVAPGIEQGIKWRGYQLETIAASEDGNFIVMGEGESLSHLMVFPVK